MESARKAIRILEEIPARPPLSAAIATMGDLLYQDGKEQAAIAHHERALEIRRGLGNDRRIAASLRDLGGIHQRAGRRQDALEALKEARDLDLRSGAKECAVTLALLAMLGEEEPRVAEETLLRNRDGLSVRNRLLANFSLWRAGKKPGHLEAARRLLCRLRDNAPEMYRETMIARVPIHRDVAEAWEEFVER
jgi:tetratricopeptide (TPR) repeat protein